MNAARTAKDRTPEQQMEVIARAALSHWGLEGATIDLLKFRENAVYKVSAGAEKFALRVHRAGYHSDQALRSELQWIRALAGAGIEVPSVVATRSGEPFAVVRTGEGAGAQVDLFEWIDGRQLGSVESGIAAEPHVVRDTYRTMGELAARLHNQSAGWTPPAGFARHAWDHEGLAGEQPLWGRFWELASLSAEERALLGRARARVYEELSRLPRTPPTYSMIHADFAPENLLVDGAHVRLIDFDDAGFGWHLFELVTSLYFVMDEPWFDEAREALIEGYRSERPLADGELARLPLFFLARSFTYVGWVHTRPGTETARKLTPMLVEAACGLAENYLRDA